MKKEAIFAKKGPKPIGPYSQAVKFGNLLFVSGQVGVDVKTGNLKEGIEGQVRQTFKNIGAILKEADLGFDDVLKVNVYLQNVDDFAKMNEIYAHQFKEPFPARATVEVARLPKGALIEIELLAGLKNRADSYCGGECQDCGC